MIEFGLFIRKVRENILKENKNYSLRQVAIRVGIQPAYLSRIELGDVSPPGEKTIKRLAEELDEDPDYLLALAGKVSSDIQEIIRERPMLLTELLRLLKNVSNEEVEEFIRKIKA